MGLIANLLKRKSVPQEEVDSSLEWLDKLKKQRGAEVGKYLDLMYDPRKIPSPSAPSTIEDLDERMPQDSSVYSPPLATVAVQPTETGDPIETGINRFFDVFAGQASSYNQTVKTPELAISIQRPRHSGETFPEADGKPVLNASLHTAHWGIFFFGHDANIDIYLLPYDETIPLTFKEVHDDGSQPLLAVTTCDGSTGREWYVDGKLLVRKHLPDMSMELIDDLVEASSK